MRREDLPAVMAIENALFSDPWPADVYRRQLQTSYTFYLALWACRGTEKTLAGYTGGMYYLPEAHLANIAVAKPWQGRGLGGLLLLAFLQEAVTRGATEVYLDVRRSNITAQDVYRRFGFSVIATRRRYYNDKEDALVMSRRLSPPAIAEALRRQWRFVQQSALPAA